MSRKVRDLTVLLLCAVLPAVGCRGGGLAPTDIVIVTLDTTRRDHLGVYGYDRPVSPHLDEFARQGDLYLRAYANSSWTVPSHASIFTGLEPTDHGAHMNEETIATLPPEALTLAEHLSGRGYATAAFLGALTMEERFGLGQGFDVYDADFSRHKTGRPADELTRRALEWVRGQEGRPIFLVVNYFDPHKPYRPPEPCHSRFAEGLPPAGPIPKEWFATPLPEQLRLYDAEICFMDSQFAELMDGLRGQGRFDAAVIAVVGDHGEAFGEHGQVGHARSLIEPLIRVPLMVKRSHQRLGTKVEEPFSVRRLFHLALREAGVPLPAGWPVSEIERTWILSEVVNSGPLRAVIRWPWKLVRPAAGEATLYDLSLDPGEEADLGAERADVRDELEALLGEWLAQRPQRVPSQPAEIDPELRRQLRALGYLN